MSNSWEEFKQGCKKLTRLTRHYVPCNEQTDKTDCHTASLFNTTHRCHCEESEARRGNLIEAENSYSSFNLSKNTSLGIDHNTNKKLKSGKYQIDYKLDLHGCTLDEAYDKLERIINSAYEQGLRCILVITGKGLRFKREKTIKQAIQEWLFLPQFSSKIIKYTDATKQHGGTGAIYILLKK